MKQEIITHLNNPGYLEKLYRSNKSLFKQEFSALHPEFPNNDVARCWHERLYYKADDNTWGKRYELTLVIVLALVAGCIAKIPDFFHLNEEQFYTRNIGFVIFPVVTVYFGWKNQISVNKIITIVAIMLTGLLFINWLPGDSKSNTLKLSCVHLLLFLWSVSGFAFSGSVSNAERNRLSYLRYNGELIIITVILVITGYLITAIFTLLFSMTGFPINVNYLINLATFGLPAAVMIGTYLTQTNPPLVGKISPLIARLFTPLVLVGLVIYLVAAIISKNNLYHDRNFLIIFNVLLVAVMALIFFSVAGNENLSSSKSQLWNLLLLSVVTIIVNSMALSAIVFRIAEWGLTPNRAAVVGSNVLILLNLLLVTYQLARIQLRKTETDKVGKTIAQYLPVYFFWAVIVVFIFPFWFEFR